MSPQRKPGTRPRGERAAITMRVPVDQRTVYEEQAATLGIPLSSWVALKLAEAQKLPVPDYVKEELQKAHDRRALEAEQEELPLARTG